MSKLYSGIKVLQVNKEIIDELYKNKKIKLWNDKNVNWYQNLYVVVKSGESPSALARVKGDKLILLQVNNNTTVSGVRPRNKEQCMALDALLDDSIKVVFLTGKAGTGKTILTLAAALKKMEESSYNRIILTRPMSQVGKYNLGILPGMVSEKLEPYLENYMCNLEYMIGGKREKVRHTIEQYSMEFIPFQLIRGASWAHSFITADETQILGAHEMVTLGTRIGEKSKLVVLGDLAQRDEKIAREKTGIYKFVNHEETKNSPLVASIELLKSERSDVAELFASVFEAY